MAATSKALAAAPQSSSWLRVPSNSGPLLRLTGSGLELRGTTLVAANQARVAPSRPQVNRSKGPPLGGTLSVSDCLGTQESVPCM